MHGVGIKIGMQRWVLTVHVCNYCVCLLGRVMSACMHGCFLNGVCMHGLTVVEAFVETYRDL